MSIQEFFINFDVIWSRNIVMRNLNNALFNVIKELWNWLDYVMSN